MSTINITGTALLDELDDEVGLIGEAWQGLAVAGEALDDLYLLDDPTCRDRAIAYIGDRIAESRRVDLLPRSVIDALHVIFDRAPE